MVKFYLISTYYMSISVFCSSTSYRTSTGSSGMFTCVSHSQRCLSHSIMRLFIFKLQCLTVTQLEVKCNLVLFCLLKNTISLKFEFDISTSCYDPVHLKCESVFQSSELSIFYFYCVYLTGKIQASQRLVWKVCWLISPWRLCESYRVEEIR